MADPQGFAWTERANGEVVVSHRGKVAAILRGARAADFLEAVGSDQDQELMARVTGNYKRGNERTARQHPRNRGPR